MPLKTREQYIESLRKLNLKVFMFGKRVENPVDHPIIRPSLNAVAMTYEAAEGSKTDDLMTATSNLTGERVNRFTHLHRSADDLIRKVKMQRMLGQRTASCFQRCVGMDAANALYSTTFEMDKAHGTQYFGRFSDYWKYVQTNDLTVDGAMTDPKGDRSLPPGKQADPDLYLRVVERRPDGVVVRGAKCHQTGIINSHEVVVMPTIALKQWRSV